ncbi:Peptidoglycan/LPS O-acetylase OafA/YrhL, contains acyltransferase and SGNH-hydrolase domains [Verrucomicrobium sp. GAS474]|nr:Peptidoglycan/LPS O-acetylase OafA/YrhL, contains acyltransferase and SGNH-hydrolase domains [Verrucomicrobium sp. GAS474]
MIERPDHQRNFYLDALRGVAVLIVVFSHASNEHHDIVPGLHLQGVGKMGVWLFFVLSAFLLTRRLVEEFDAGKAPVGTILVRYGIHRLCRIFPLYLLVVFGHALWLGRGGEGMWYFFWRNALLLEGHREFWVIPVEVKYYAVMPLFCLLHVFLWRRRFVPALAVLGGIALGCSWHWALDAGNKNTLLLWPYFAIFAVGSLLAVMPPKLFRFWGSRGMTAGALILLLVPLFCILGHSTTVTMPRLYVWSPLLAVLWSSVLAFGLTHGRNLPMPVLSGLAAGTLRGVGRISFSIYLLHYPILKTLLAHPVLPGGLQGIASLVLVLFAAYFSWRFVEEPCILFGKQWGERVGHKGIYASFNRSAAE